MANLENQRLTVGGLVKLIGLVAVLIGWTLAVYAWVESIDTRAELDRQQQQLAHKAIEKRLDALEACQEENRRVNAELTRAVDRAAVILEQINKRLDAGGGHARI